MASPLSSSHSGPSLPPAPAPTSAAPDAFLTLAPHLINNMRAGAIRSSRKPRTHWSGHQPPQKGRCEKQGLKVCSSSQTSLVALQERECGSSMQTELTICNYECWHYVYFPSRFSHPDLWLPARDVWGSPSDSAWMDTIADNVSTQNPKKSKWKDT